jgi:hypothetical protein
MDAYSATGTDSDSATNLSLFLGGGPRSDSPLVVKT